VLWSSRLRGAHSSDADARASRLGCRSAPTSATFGSFRQNFRRLHLFPSRQSRQLWRMGILKGIPPLLTADLLHILRSMGHGDKLCICDANFPASEVAGKTTTGEKIELSCDLPTAVDAICSVLPLDMFVDSPASHMSPSEGVALPVLGAEVHAAFKTTVAKHCPGVNITPCERFAFYEEARACRHLESASHCIPMRTSLRTQRPAQASFLTGTSALLLTALAASQALALQSYRCSSGGLTAVLCSRRASSDRMERT
jgi:L-fucose mutarotase